MESCIWNIWNPYYDIIDSPVFMSVIILTNNVEVDIHSCEVQCNWIHEECTRCEMQDPGKGANKRNLVNV